MVPSNPHEVRLSWLWRVALVGVGCVLVFGFFLASQVKPDPRGMGTHQQFGLPPCSFQMVFGIPCPSCGGTTSFAHFVRGQFVSAWRANSAACLLAVICLFAVPWTFVSSWRGQFLIVKKPAVWLMACLVALAAVSLIQWLWRLQNL